MSKTIIVVETDGIHKAIQPDCTFTIADLKAQTLNSDVYVTLYGKPLSDDIKISSLDDGSTIALNDRLLGGGREGRRERMAKDEAAKEFGKVGGGGIAAVGVAKVGAACCTVS